MGVAADLARAELQAEATRLAALRDRLLTGLVERVRGSRVTGALGGDRLPHHTSLVVPGVKADSVLLQLDLRGVAASSGSACAAPPGAPPHLPPATGRGPEAPRGAPRVS